jgi:hypothetical protein
LRKAASPASDTSIHLGSGGGVWNVTVVPVPPFVRSALRVALRRILPNFLAAERRHVEVAPNAPHRLVAAAIDEVGAEPLIAIADESVVAVPLVDAEVAGRDRASDASGDRSQRLRLTRVLSLFGEP